MFLQIVITILFILGTGLYFCVLLYSAKWFDKYTPAKYSISMLGSRKSSKKRVYNTATILYGLLNMAFATVFKEGFAFSTLNNLFANFQTTLGISMVFVGIIPVDLNKRVHDLFGVILFTSSFLIGLIGIVLTIRGVLPKPIGFGDVALILIILLFSYQFVKFTLNRGVHKITWMLEWVWVFLFTAHSLFLATSLLGRLLG